jgi:hypothetical protein
MLTRVEQATPPELVEIIAEATRQIEAEHTPPWLKRDAHPKMHGCVQATLEVADLQDPEYEPYARGVFAHGGRTYNAWVRFSNAFSIQHDLEVETRGMAVKLLEVTGDALPEAEVVSTPDGDRYTQDFLFATHDAFFLPDPSEYLDFLKAVRSASLGVGAFYRNRWPRLHRGFMALVWSQLKGATFNPLALTYFSQTPYKLGKRTVKLRMVPVNPPSLQWYRKLGFWLIVVLANIVFFALEPLTKRGKAWAENFCDRHFASRDMLRFAMMETLAVEDATFALQVQEAPPRIDLNDATLQWKGEFKTVATLHIPSQMFWPQAGLPKKLFEETTRLVKLGENMSFSPWHGLVDHTPVGSINVARRWIYRDIARFRRDGNHIDSDSMPRRQVEAWHELKPFIQEGRVA